MTFGDLPAKGMGDPSGSFFPRGGILNRDLSKVHEVDLSASDQVQEYVAHSWYDYAGGKQPLEVLRTIHSFDPCLACATHRTDEEGEGFEMKVV